MKKYLLISMLVAACAFGQGRQRIEPKAYFRGDVGWVMTEDMDANFPFPGAGSVTMDLDPGIRFSAAGGAQFGPFFALELETGWGMNSIDEISGFDDVDGWVSQVPFLANAVFQFKNNTGLTPFIGAGAGGSAVGLYLDEAQSAFVELDGSSSDFVFAWQVFAGLRVELNEQFSVGLMYKYFWSDNGEWEVDDTSQDIEFGEAQSHTISAVVNFNF